MYGVEEGAADDIGSDAAEDLGGLDLCAVEKSGKLEPGKAVHFLCKQATSNKQVQNANHLRSNGE